MATHTGISHLYAVVRYKGKPTSQWQNETSQWGFRLGVTFGDSTPPLTAGDHEFTSGTVVDSAFSQDIPNQRREFGFSNDGATDAYSLAFQGVVLNHLMTYVTALKPWLGGMYAFSDVRLYAVKGDGTSPCEPTILTPLSTTYDPAPSPTDQLPPQTAVAVSFSSGVRSRRGRGRVFLGPMARGTQDTQGLVQPTARTPLLAAHKTLFDSLRGISADPGVATAVPIVWHKPGFTGAVISSVRIDDMFDTQRRREGQRIPVWVEETLTP